MKVRTILGPEPTRERLGNLHRALPSTAVTPRRGTPQGRLLNVRRVSACDARGARLRGVAPNDGGRNHTFSKKLLICTILVVALEVDRQAVDFEALVAQRLAPQFFAPLLALFELLLALLVWPGNMREERLMEAATGVTPLTSYNCLPVKSALR